MVRVRIWDVRQLYISASSGPRASSGKLIPGMHCTCVRHTDFPHTSHLFADVLYHPDRVGKFYRHPFRDLDSFTTAAAEINFPEERRAALVDALRVQNPQGPSLEMLARPGTV